MRGEVREVVGDEREALIAWLGDSPQTVKAVHRLRRGGGRGWVVGAPGRLDAAVVEALDDPEEHAGFGGDPEAIWTLVRRIDGWSAVHVEAALGAGLAEVIERETGSAPTPIEEIFFTPSGPITTPARPDVRPLSDADLPVVAEAAVTLGMNGWRPEALADMVTGENTAAAVVGGELVALAFAGLRGDRHVEVGIRTRPDHRGRGLATAAAGLVCVGIQAAGDVPVWSTSEENVASRRVAAKLGFVEVSRRVYLNRR